MVDSIFMKSKVKKVLPISIESESLFHKLRELLNSEKLYVDPNLKIADLAEKMDTSTHELSKVINENFGKGFPEFINGYRVEEAKRLIGTNTNYTVEAIGKMSGFNSKSAFYKAFKTYTNTTPAKYNPDL